MMPAERLLVADADPRSLRIVELALRRAGFAVETAPDAAEALIRARRAHAVVCDAALDPDGGTFCASLRADSPGLPLVIIGADRSPGARARAIDAGADEYLAKPVLVKELVQKLQVLLQQRRISNPDAPAALTGSVADLGLVDLFQSLENWKRSAVVRCDAPRQTARVWVREGEVIDAELGPLSGAPAVWRLLTWEVGEYRVEFTRVEREATIEGGTQEVLVEAMRRMDELSRAAESLPMTARLSIDLDRLGTLLADLPDEVNGVLRHFDGRRSVREVIDLSPVDDLSALEVVRRLLADGILPAREAPVVRPAAHDEALAIAEEMAHEEERTLTVVPDPVPVRILRFPSVRGVRRERLRREAEQARAVVAAGAPVRLHHVVELPPRDPSEELAALRHASPAVGEAAKRFAPDVPLARVALASAAQGEQIAAAVAPTLPPHLVALRWVRDVAPVTRARLERVFRDRRHRWAAAAAGVALVGAWLLWPQPKTARESSPWLAETKAAPAPQRPPPAPAPSADYAAAFARGQELFRSAKYREAVEEFRKAVAARPESVAALLALGESWLEADRPRNALHPLETAARLDPASGRAQLLLGTAYQSLGRTADATRAYQRYLEVEPGGDFAADVRVILANLDRRR